MNHPRIYLYKYSNPQKKNSQARHKILLQMIDGKSIERMNTTFKNPKKPKKVRTHAGTSQMSKDKSKKILFTTQE